MAQYPIFRPVTVVGGLAPSYEISFGNLSRPMEQAEDSRWIALRRITSFAPLAVLVQVPCPMKQSLCPARCNAYWARGPQEAGNSVHLFHPR